MIGPALLYLLQSAALMYPGAGKPPVTVPRAQADAVIDGQMNEAQWTQAARLTGFHQLQPVDPSSRG